MKFLFEKVRNKETGISLFLFSFVATLLFQNCGKFSTLEEISSNSMSSLSVRNSNYITGEVINPMTGKAGEVVYHDDIVFPKIDSVSSGPQKNSGANPVDYHSGSLATDLIKWPTNGTSTTIYLVKNQYIPWGTVDSNQDGESDEFRKVMDRIKVACDRWKAVANFNCVEIPVGQNAPTSDLVVFVSLAQIQTVDPVRKILLFRTDGTASNFCGMIHDQTDNKGVKVAGTYSPFSCATIGYGMYDNNGIARRHPTAFIAINREHVDAESVYVHEVGHLLGLSHPQIRNDRDNAVILNPNFPSDFSRFADYRKSEKLPGYGAAFDFGSMLTYRFPHSTGENYLSFSENLNRLIQLANSGASSPTSTAHTDWTNYASKVQNGAYAMKNENFESQYPQNNSSRLSGGGFPSPVDATTAIELYGQPQATGRTCLFNSTTMPHGTRVGAYETGQAAQVGDYCNVVPVVCNDGTLSHSSRITSCAARCSIGGRDVKLGEIGEYFESSSVPVGQTCSKKQVLCVKEKLGTRIAGYQSCAPEQAVVGLCPTATSPVTQFSSGTCVRGTVEPIGFVSQENAFKWRCVGNGGTPTCSQPAITCPSGQTRQGNGTSASPFTCQSNAAPEVGECPNASAAVSVFAGANCRKGIAGTATFSAAENAFKWTCSAEGGSPNCAQPVITCPSGQTRQGSGTNASPFTCQSNAAPEVGECQVTNSAVAQKSNGTCVKGLPSAIQFVSAENAFKWSCDSSGGNTNCAQPSITCPSGHTRQGNGITSELTCQPPATAEVSCVYLLKKSLGEVGSTYAVIEPGENAYEYIKCSNLPAGAVVKIIGTANDLPQIDAVITLQANGELVGLTPNTDPKLAATYIRYIQVKLGTTELFRTPPVTGVLKTDVRCPVATSAVRKMDAGICAQGSVSDFFFNDFKNSFEWKCSGAGGSLTCSQRAIVCSSGSYRDGDGTTASPFVCRTGPPP